MIKLFGKELLLYVPAQAVPALLSFVSVIVFTRLLSAEKFGRYALVMSSVLVATTLLDWLCMAIIRFYPAASEREAAVLVRTSFWAQSVSACVVGVVTFILTRILWPANVLLQHLMGIGVLIFVFNSIFYLFAQVLRARLQPGAYSLFLIWAKAVGVGLSILFAAHLQLGEVGILWGIAIGIATTLPFLWRKVFADTSILGPVSGQLLCEMAWYGIPLVMGNLGSWVLSQSDRYLIHLFYSAQEVGIYSAVYIISENSIKLLSTLFIISSTPLLVNVWEKQGEEASRRSLSSVTRLYLLVTIPAVTAMSALAVPIMKLLMGSAFSDGHAIVPLVVIGAFFIGLQHRFNQVLLLLKRSHVIMLWMMVFASLNVILNWWLLPLFDYKIAAVTTLLCSMLYCIVLALESRRYFQWPFPWTTAVRSVCAASIIFGGASLLTRATDFSPLLILCLIVPLGILAYGLSLWFLGEISQEEHKTLKEEIRRCFGLITTG